MEKNTQVTTNSMVYSTATETYAIGEILVSFTTHTESMGIISSCDAHLTVAETQLLIEKLTKAINDVEDGR